MIKLRNNPVEGSCVKLSLSFRDPLGNFYVPSSVCYTILALNNDEESWTVVDNVYRKEIEPSSSVVLVTPPSNIVEGTTLVRKIIIYWTSLFDNAVSDFVDEVNYEVQPLPYVPDVPVPPSPEYPDVTVTEIKLQSGSIAEAPINPIFIAKVNVPVIPDSGSCVVRGIDNDSLIPCSVSIDSSGTVLTVSCNEELGTSLSYKFEVDGYKGINGVSKMKQKAEMDFRTTSKGRVQEEKDVTVEDNGNYEIVPDTGYSSLGKVNLTVDVAASPEIQPDKEITFTENDVVLEIRADSPYNAMRKVTASISIPMEEDKNVEITSNGIFVIEPETGNAGMKKVTATVDVPSGKPEQSKEVIITENTVTTVVPDSGKTLSEVKVTTNIPAPFIETGKEVTITSNGDRVVTPTSPNVAMDSVTVHTEIPLEANKEVTITSNGDTPIVPTTPNVGMSSVTVHTAVPIESGKEVTITSNGTSTVTPSSPNVGFDNVVINVNVPAPVLESNKTESITANGTYEITPTSPYPGMEKATVTVTVPDPELELNKNTSIDVSSYNTPVEITPTSPYPGMKKATVALTNVPVVESNKTATFTSNNVYEIVPSTGNTVMEKATVTVAVPLETNKPESIDVMSYASPVEITPTTGNTAMQKATVTLTNVPVLESSKSETITSNGSTVITPTAGNTAMRQVVVTTAIPLEENKTETLTTNGEHVIVPTSGNTAMKKSTVIVAVPIESGKTQTIGHNGTVTISPSTGYVGMEDVEVTVNVPIESGKTQTIEHNSTVTISPSTGYDGLEDVEVTVAVPLEDNKQVSVDLEDYANPIEITPTTGNDGMEKATVTLTNMTRLYVWKDSNATPNPHYMYTTYSDTSKCDGHAYQCGTVKNALLASKNVEVNGDALYVSGYPSSLYYRDPSNDMQF